KPAAVTETASSPVKIVAAAPVVVTAPAVAAIYVSQPQAAATNATHSGSASGTAHLSPSTRARIEANRRRALEKRAQALQAKGDIDIVPSSSTAGQSLPTLQPAALTPAVAARTPLVEVPSNTAA